MEVLGRARIEQARLEELGKIETRRKEALASLNIKFKTADQAKTSFGFIGITSLSLLFGAILLNDLVKLMNAIYEHYLDFKVRRNYLESEVQDEKKNNQIQIEMDRDYSLDLEEKLEKFHLKLAKAVAKNKKYYP